MLPSYSVSAVHEVWSGTLDVDSKHRGGSSVCSVGAVAVPWLVRTVLKTLNRGGMHQNGILSQLMYCRAELARLYGIVKLL